MQYSAPATQNYLQMTGAVKSFAAPGNNYLLMNGDKDNNVASGKRVSSVIDPVYSNGNRQSAKNEYVNPPMGGDYHNTANHADDNYIPATTAGDLDVVVTTTASQQNDAANEDFSAGYKAMF